MLTFEHRKPDTTTGELRTPVVFYEYAPKVGPEPGETKRKELFSCFAEVYNPSMKDLAIMDIKGTKEAVTIRIRDSRGEYLPTDKHFAQLDDYRYRSKVFSVVDVRNDLAANRFITILLEVTK